MNNDHDPEPQIVADTTAEAGAIVKRLSTVLQLAGWDAIIISVSRRVRGDNGHYYGPGATSTMIDRAKIGPIVGQLAEVLRKQAAMLEAHADPRDEVDSGYIHDRTDYASGCAEWPK